MNIMQHVSMGRVVKSLKLLYNSCILYYVVVYTVLLWNVGQSIKQQSCSFSIREVVNLFYVVGGGGGYCPI